MLNTQHPANSWSTCARCILYVYFSWFKASHLFCLNFLQPSHRFFHDFKRHLHPWLRQGPQLKACGWTLAAQLQVHLDWSKKFNGGIFFAQQLAKGWRSSNTLRFDLSKMGERRYICKQTEISSSHTHSPKTRNCTKSVPRRFLLEKRPGRFSGKRQKAKDCWDPTTISTWVILTGLAQEGIPSVLSASTKNTEPEGCQWCQPLQTLWTNLMFLLNLSNQNRLNMVLRPSKLEVVTYLDAFFVKNLHFKWNLPSSAKVFWQMWNLPYIWRASISQLNERKTDWEGILGEASQNMAKQKDLNPRCSVVQIVCHVV